MSRAALGGRYLCRAGGYHIRASGYLGVRFSPVAIAPDTFHLVGVSFRWRAQTCERCGLDAVSSGLRVRWAVEGVWEGLIIAQRSPDRERAAHRLAQEDIYGKLPSYTWNLLL